MNAGAAKSSKVGVCLRGNRLSKKGSSCALKRHEKGFVFSKEAVTPAIYRGKLSRFGASSAEPVACPQTKKEG